VEEEVGAADAADEAELLERNLQFLGVEDAGRALSC
jgi:hypothetical protein